VASYRVRDVNVNPFVHRMNTFNALLLLQNIVRAGGACLFRQPAALPRMASSPAPAPDASDHIAGRAGAASLIHDSERLSPRLNGDGRVIVSRGAAHTCARRKMTDSQPAFNYSYFIDQAARIGGRILDYGCGRGQVLALGLKRGLDIWGADTFEGYFAGWSGELPPQVCDRVRNIREGQTDFPNGYFDLVMANQVLEHVTDPAAVIADIHRMLKPGGLFIAAFPVVETWYEGHVGLYFAHRLAPGSHLRRTYFDFCHRIGRGLYRNKLTRAGWIKQSEHTLDTACFYYPHRHMFTTLTKVFGTPIEDISVHYMRARLRDRARNVPTFADSILRFVYHKRAGELIKVRKSK
jgi:SAM-dependent methyltransferase